MQPTTAPPTMPTDVQLECSYNATPAQVAAYNECVKNKPDALLRAGINDEGWLVMIYQTGTKRVVSAAYDRDGTLRLKQFYKDFDFTMKEPVDFLFSKQF